jgi:hypothetical protein
MTSHFILRNAVVLVPPCLALYDCGTFQLRVNLSLLTAGDPVQPLLQPGCRCCWTRAKDRWVLIINSRCPVHTDSEE